MKRSYHGGLESLAGVGLMILLLSAVEASAVKTSGTERGLALPNAAFRGGKLGPELAAARYVTLDLEYKPFRTLTAELEKREGVSLKNRGEAHITLITPPEYESLIKTFTDAEIRDAFSGIVTKPPRSVDLRSVCVGRGDVGPDRTYFVVVAAKAALEARRVLARRALARTTFKPSFNPDEFYPHVTLGFTARDLHLQDGVIKDSRSCILPIGR